MTDDAQVSRRGALAIVVGGVAGFRSIGAIAGEVIDPVLPLAARLKILRNETEPPGSLGDIHNRMPLSDPGYGPLDEHLRGIYERQLDLEREMLGVVATSFAGLIAQLEVLETYPDFEDNYGFTIGNVTAGLRRLSGGLA
jgi:hypothetical protein